MMLPLLGLAFASLSADRLLFNSQLDIARSFVEETASRPPGEEHDIPVGRTRFREHSRYTCRFGDVLTHAASGGAVARDGAAADAAAVLAHVDAHDGSVRPGLGAGLARALSSGETARFRREQLANASRDYADSRRLRADADVSAVSDSDAVGARGISDSVTADGATVAGSADDFSLFEADSDLVGRLYYSAVEAATPTLREVGSGPRAGSGRGWALQ